MVCLRWHKKELNGIEDFEKRIDRLTELNVINQVKNLAKTRIVQEAWHAGRKLEIHGWVYGLNSGLITELNTLYDEKGDIEDIYHYEIW